MQRRNLFESEHYPKKYLPVAAFSDSTDPSGKKSSRPASFALLLQKTEVRDSDPYYAAVGKTIKTDCFVSKSRDFGQWGEAEKKQKTHSEPCSPNFVDYCESGHGYEFTYAYDILLTQQNHGFISVSKKELDAMAAALEESAINPDGHIPNLAPILYQPPLHRSAWPFGDDVAAAHHPRRSANQGRRCSLQSPNWSAALHEGIETLSAIQMVGDNSCPAPILCRLKSLPP